MAYKREGQFMGLVPARSMRVPSNYARPDSGSWWLAMEASTLVAELALFKTGFSPFTMLAACVAVCPDMLAEDAS